MKPHHAVTLGVDPAHASGWSIFVVGELVAHGATTTAAGRAEAVALAKARADHFGLPLVAVVERWDVARRTGGANFTTASLIGMGAARGRWLEQLALAGLPDSRVVGAEQKQWRVVLAGLPRRTGEEAKASAVQFARARFRLGPDLDENEAEAICLGWWSCHAVEVGEVLPKRHRTQRSG